MNRLAVGLLCGLAGLTGCVKDLPRPEAVADHTKYVQGLFDSETPTVTVGAGTWEVDPLFVRRPHKEIVLADGCRLLAKKGGFKGMNDTLVKVEDGCHDVVIRGEGKAVLEMRLSDYDDPKQYRIGEWRHGLAVWGATNVTVRNLTVLRTGGDGLYVRGAKGLTVEDFVADDGYRLGLGLISAEDMVVRNSVFRNTHGTPPKCGIDLEPNKDTERLVNILFEDCVFEGNEASGVLFHLCQFSDKTEPVSVTLRNCVSRGNRSAGYQLTTTGDKGIVRGGITFENCRSEGNAVDITHFNQCDAGIKIVETGCNFTKRTVSKYVKPVGTAPLRFETLKPLSTKDPAKPLSTGWMRSPFTFIQWVPKAGKYPIRFTVRQVGPRAPEAKVRVKDRLGTDLGSFDIPAGGREYVIESRGEGILRFEVTPNSCAVAVESPWAGAGLRADFPVHFFTGTKRAYAFRVPKDAKEVSVNVVPQEPCASSLVDASGATVARQPHGIDKAVLKAGRTPSAADEAWRFVLDKADEDAFISVGAPCEPVLWLVEPESAKAASVHDARLFAQVEVSNIANDDDRARYLADMRKAGLDCVFLSVVDYFEEGEERERFFRRLKDDIRFFEANGLAVAVWLNGFGYGNARKGAAARRLAGEPPLTAFDGRTNGAVCPTGSAIRWALAENVRDIARAGARMILMDDDFVQSVRPGLCCVCPNHLKRISARVGRPVGAADVRDAFAGRPNGLRRAALDVSGEVVLELARELRRAVDAVDPSIGMGLCASYTHWDVEGVDLEALLAAFAGRNRRFFRISGAPYWKPRCDGYNLDTIVEFVRQQAAWCRQLSDTTVFDENDPWPRKVAEVPAWKCELYDKATIADGVLGRHKYMFCYGPDRAEPGYLDAHLANRPDDARLAALFAGTQSYGIRVLYPRQSLRDAVLPTPYCGDRDLMLQYSHAKGATLLTRNGLPARHEGRGPALVLGQAALGVTQDDLRDGIVADRAAAKVLSGKGIDVGAARVKVLDFSACGSDFGYVRSEAVAKAVRNAVEGFSKAPIAVRLASPSAGVYLLVRHDPAKDEYAVLLENLTERPLPVKLRTPRACRIVGSLRGDFREEKGGIVLSALPAHGFAAVRFAWRADGDLALVADGRPLASVVIPADALPAERLAAKELIDHVRLITGVTLPLGGSRSCAIRLGRAAGLKTDDLPPGAARIVADRTGLAIAGRDGKGDPLARTTEAGTLLGVYDFLENDLGVRWLWPGKLGTTAPKARTLTVAGQARVARPMAFSEWRTDSESAAAWAKKENAERFVADQRLWLRRHRYSCLGNLNKGHAYTDYYRRFGKEHPEYFNVLPDGTRRADPFYINGRDEFVSMCVTEPALVRRIVDEWAHNPKSDAVLNGNENDTSGKCCCARCLAADGTGDDAGRLARAREKFAAKDPKWVRELGSTSGRYAAFYKALIDEGTKARPDCRVIAGTYANYSDPPPDGTTLGDRVILRYCPPIMYPWTDQKVADFKRIWDGWSKTGARLMMRPNFMLDGHNFPLLYYRWYVRCFDFARDHGLDSMDSDSLTGQFGANGLTLYVIAAKNGRPMAPLADLENDFFAAFGPAAERIRAYMAHFERVSDRGAAPDGSPTNNEGGFWANFYTYAERLYTPEVMARGFALLDEAEKLAQGDPLVRARIGFLRAGLTDCNLVMKVQRGAVRVQKEGVEADFAAAYRELLAFRAAHEHLGYAARDYMAYLEGRLWPRHLGMLTSGARKLSGWTLQAADDDTAHPVELNSYPRDAKGEYRKVTLTYRTSFDLSAADAAKPFHLLFGAVDGDPCVELNGQVVLTKNPLGGRLPDRTPFKVDVKGKLVAGKNVLTVRVDKKSGPRGIHRPIYLDL